MRSHPFSRWAVHHDQSTQENLPIKGAVTDGAARVMIEVVSSELNLNEPLRYRLKDTIVQGETKGIGELLLENSDGAVITRGVSIDVPTPAELQKTLYVYYVPPPAFVRPEHRDTDTFLHLASGKPRLLRNVKLEVEQPGLAAGSTQIELVRPPVMLFHGYGGDPSVWNEFLPLVPPTGVSGDSSSSVPGYDERFRLFAVGTHGTVRPVDVEAKANYPIFRQALNSPEMQGYAISKVDIVSFSMGGVISREIARQFAQELHLSVPIGRYITIGTPHMGSTLASFVAQVRDSDELFVQPKFDPLALLQAAWEERRPALNDLIKVQWCAVVLRDITAAVGPHIVALDIRSGALDDLRSESQRMAILKETGILMPSHMIVGESNTINFGANHQIKALWFGLGMLCNWTPDETTVETTKLLAQAPANLWTVFKALGLNDWSAQWDTIKLIYESLTNSGEGPSQVLTRTAILNGLPSGGNDRIVPARSQRNDAPANARYVTRVVADTDHLAMKITNLGAFHPDNNLAKCNQYIAAAWNSPAQQPSTLLSDNDMIPCLVVFLLDVDPAYKPANASAPMYRPADEPNTARAVSNDRSTPSELRRSGTNPIDLPLVELGDSPLRSRNGGVEIPILSPRPGAIVQAGEVVQVTAQFPSTVTLASLAFVNDEYIVDVVTNTGAISYTAMLTIPLQSLGTQTLGVVGVTAYETITDLVYYGGSVDVVVDPGPLLDLRLFGPTQLNSIGQVEQLQLYGLFADNLLRSLSAPSLGATYRSLNPAVLAVSSHGWVQARSRGSTVVLATFRHPVTGKAAVASLEVQVNLSSEDTNRIPVAANIPRQTVGTEEIVFLNAGASSDPDGDPLTYHWRQTGGRAVVLLNDGTWRPQFVSPYVTRPDTLTFELTVADDKGAETLPVEVKVTVEP